MGNINKYPENIMVILRKRCGLEANDHSIDDVFNELEKRHVFGHVVAWNGLLGGYDYEIKRWIKDIYGIDIDEEFDKRSKLQ